MIMPKGPAQKSDSQLQARLSVSAAAQILKISPSSLRRLEKEGRITSLRETNGYRSFSVVDITALKEKLEEEKKQKKELKNAPITPLPDNEVYSKTPIIKARENVTMPVEKNVERKEEITPQKIFSTQVPAELSQFEKPLKINLNFASYKKAFSYPLQTTFIILFVFMLSNVLIKNAQALMGRTPLIASAPYSDFLNKSIATLLSNDDNNNAYTPFGKNLASVLAGKARNANYVFNVNVPSSFKESVAIEGALSVQGSSSLIGALNVTGLSSLNGGLSTPSVSNVTSIDNITETTIEEALDLSGDVTGTLADTQIVSLKGVDLGDMEAISGNILIAKESKWESLGTTEITELGTITTGTWEATELAPEFGGTGLTTYATGDLLIREQ